METTSHNNAIGYSSDVKLSLLVHGEIHELSQTGPDSCVLRWPRDVPAGEAELVIQIDDNEQRQRVLLTTGTANGSRVLHYRRK